MPRWRAHCIGVGQGALGINPLSYQTDILRTLMLRGAQASFGLAMDFAVLTGSLIVLVAIAARLYPRVVL